MDSRQYRAKQEGCTNMEEIWKPVTGYEGRFYVSNLGNVKRESALFYRKDGQLQGVKLRYPTQHTDRLGYLRVDLQYQGKRKAYLVHRLVAQEFIPNPENKREVNHIDGNKKNNKAENLEWCTRLENMQHAHRIGLMPKVPSGADHKRSRPVAMYDPITNKLLREFVNIAEAAVYLGRKTSSQVSKITACCRGKRQSAYGYKWKYISPESVSTNSVDNGSTQ